MGYTKTTAASEEPGSSTFRTVAKASVSPSIPAFPAGHGQFAAQVLQRSARLVSPHEAAERLGVKRSTIYALCAKGQLPHVRVGSLLRIDVDGFLAGRYRFRQ